jgi:hypothetical protein
VNKGIYEEAYQITVDSEGWVSVAPEYEYVRLKPAQQVNMPVKATLPCTDAKKASYVTIKQLRSPFQKIELKLDLESVSERTCYNVEMLQQSYDINYESSSIPLLLQNNGLKGGDYILSLDPAEAKFLTLQEDKKTLNPGEVAVVYAYPVNQSEYLDGKYLSKLTLKITPVEYDSIEYERQFWIVLKDKGFIAKAWAFLKGLNYTTIGACGIATLALIALLICLIIGSVFAKRKSKISRIRAANIRKMRVINMILVALLLAGLLLLVFLGAPDESKFYEESSGIAGPMFHEWKQNSQYTLDLSTYFSDPDSDELAFSASQPDHIQVKVDGSKVTLTPEYGWSGKEYIVFTASDSKGGIADSEALALNVIKKKPIGFFDYWSLYCMQINITLFMLCLLVILLITDIVEEKGYRNYLPKRK